MSNTVSVRLVRRKNEAALVEYVGADTGRVYRVTVPAVDVQLTADGGATCATLDLGVPYGTPWARVIAEHVPPALAETIEVELQRRGVWTYEDLIAAPDAAVSALQAAYGVDAAALMRLSQSFRHDERRTL